MPNVAHIEISSSSIEYIENDETNIVEISLGGKITKEDYLACIKLMEKFIERNGRVKILEEIISLKGIDPSIIWDGMKFDLAHIKDYSHCAIVTDTGWIGIMAQAVNLLPNCEVRIFPLGEKNKAREWLKNL